MEEKNKLEDFATIALQQKPKNKALEDFEQDIKKKRKVDMNDSSERFYNNLCQRFIGSFETFGVGTIYVTMKDFLNKTETTTVDFTAKIEQIHKAQSKIKRAEYCEQLKQLCKEKKEEEYVKISALCDVILNYFSK
jgi:hypothetical protein